MTIANIVIRVMLAGALGLVTACTTPVEQRPVSFVVLQHPLVGATLTVDPATQAVAWQRDHRATWLNPITMKPQSRWLNGFQDLGQVPTLLGAAREQHSLPVFVAYFIPNRGCSGNREGALYGDYDRKPPRPDSYAAWVSELIRQLNGTRAVIVLEPDAVASSCFNDERAATIQAAIEQLVTAQQYVYVDAGNPSWLSPELMASRLLAAGVDKAEGLSLNVSNRYPTIGTANYGEKLSTLIGGRDYVIDTSRNGLEVNTFDDIGNDWCNRPQQALGIQAVGSPDVEKWPHFAGQLWVKPPGESDGNSTSFPGQDCHDESAAPGVFSPRQARQLILNDPRQPSAVLDLVRAVPESGTDARPPS